MQLRVIRAHGTSVPGDVVEVPDGAAFDPWHYEPVGAAFAVNAGEVPRAPGGIEVLKAAVAVTPVKEGM